MYLGLFLLLDSLSSNRIHTSDPRLSVMLITKIVRCRSVHLQTMQADVSILVKRENDIHFLSFLRCVFLLVHGVVGPQQIME
jgi:hypothetical protein